MHAIFLIFILLIQSAALGGEGGDPLPRPVKVPCELFNGRDLTHWYISLRGRERGSDPNAVFRVRDGILLISGQELGGIVTREAFRDYRLIVEYRFTGWVYPFKRGQAPDSGILFHSTGRDGAFGGNWLYSHEYNLVLGATGDYFGVGNKSRPDLYAEARVSPFGRGWIYDPKGKCRRFTGNDRVCNLYLKRTWKNRQDAAPGKFERPLGAWNRAELVCRGEQADFIFNGKLVNRLERVKPSGGRIQLQSEACGIEIRRVTLLPLPREEGKKTGRKECEAMNEGEKRE